MVEKDPSASSDQGASRGDRVKDANDISSQTRNANQLHKNASTWPSKNSSWIPFLDTGQIRIEYKTKQALRKRRKKEMNTAEGRDGGTVRAVRGRGFSSGRLRVGLRHDGILAPELGIDAFEVIHARPEVLKRATRLIRSTVMVPLADL